MIEVRNLFASYAGLQVLRGINLEAHAGDLVVIIGPNGSGKSTMLKCISGLLRVDHGEIIFKDQPIQNQDPADIVQKGLAFVPQGRCVFPSLTMEENLLLGGYTLPDKATKQQRLAGVYERFPALADHRRRLATFLSGGLQQLLSIGRALMLHPHVLMLDEPSLGLAVQVMREVFDKIAELNAEGTTIIMVEQNVHLALEIAQKTYLLEDGQSQLVDEAKPELKERIERMYLGV